MRIKSLYISGFKSFADPGHLNFGHGITGVVGPNGCGKSNIIDAIRWVMGEMSAKHLRGRAMQDVIFAGSESRGPSGMAEVTITFHNDGNVPPAYAAYEELAVTRRLHRDGTSEYMINKIPCRLRDITDLFLGTGVGTRAYSIIEQGRIGFIVSARPEDRRSLIEEVAGITKFKVRRKAAERRMVATEQNLARVNDIIAELERQLASLRRQAKKAERYKRVKAELKDLDLHVATMRLLELKVLEQQQQLTRAELEARYADTSRSVEGEEAALEAARLRQLEEEDRLQREQQSSAEVESKLAALERDLSHWKRQLEDTRRRTLQASAEMEQAKARLQEMGNERVTLRADLNSTRSGIEEDRVRRDTAQQAVEEVQGAIGSADAELERLRAAAVEVVHALAQQRSQLGALEKQDRVLAEQRQRAQEEQDAVGDKRGEMISKERDLHRRRERREAELLEWTGRRDTLTEELQGLQREVSASEERILGLRSDLAESRSRLESLEAIARRLEGYSEGVRTIMSPGEGDEEAKPAVDGILGLVTDVLEAQPEYERAIEALLGDKLQLLITDSHTAGMAAIRYLQERDGGRSGFVPRQPKVVRQTRGPEAHPGLVASALDVVTVQPGHEDIARYLLSDAMVVRDLDAALEIWQRNGQERTLVTLAGEVLEPAGVLTGGSEAGSGLLTQAREIRELREKVAALEEALAEASAAHRQLEARRLQAEVDIQQLSKEIRQAELEKVELVKDIEAVEKEITRLVERAEVLAYELEQFEVEQQRVASELTETRVAVEAAEGNKAALDAQLAAQQERRAALAAELEERTELLTTLKIQLASRDEKLASGQGALERLDVQEDELRQRIERDAAVITEGDTVTAELEERIARGTEDVAQIAREAQERKATLSEARAAYEAERLRMAEIEQGLRERRKGNDLVRESLIELKMDLQRLQLERGQLVERVAERHDEDLLRVAGDYHLRPLPGPEELERRTQLEKSLKSMGSINLTAIEECAEVEERYTFLIAQRDDLTGALDSLKRAIQRINRTSRQRFKDAFDKVNNMFQQVFPRLFRGGEARLELLSHDDVLEAGVDIIAQPPGKKLQNVGLLSGGEKALTATALVFSIFLIKPSPFCVLDEVDAPLDDANVGRFNEMLREISSISQFIVITHNKLTMTEADRLYGITMEEPGMSKLVQVDLDKGETAAA